MFQGENLASLEPMPMSDKSLDFEAETRAETVKWIRNFLYATLQNENSRLFYKFEGDLRGGLDWARRAEIEIFDYELNLEVPGNYSMTATDFSSLNNIHSLKVRYGIDNREEIDDFLVKTMPEATEDKELTRLLEVPQREVYFYKAILPEIEAFMENEKVKLPLSICDCLFASAKVESNVKKSYYLEENNQDYFNSEYLIVLDDLRALDFGKRNFPETLSFDEAKAALREIATIHAVSWIMQEKSGQKLGQKWPHLKKPKDSVLFFDILFNINYKTLITFLEMNSGDSLVSEFLKKLKTKKSLIKDTLAELLSLPKHKGGSNFLPTTLIHLNFWVEALLFRKNVELEEMQMEQRKEAEANGPVINYNSVDLLKDKLRDPNELECQILRWELMSYGRPTHDIALLIYSSLTPNCRRENWKFLLHFYYQIFKVTCRMFGVEVQFDMKALEAEYKKSEILAVLMLIGSIDLILSDHYAQESFIEAIRDISSSFME